MKHKRKKTNKPVQDIKVKSEPNTLFSFLYNRYVFLIIAATIFSFYPVFNNDFTNWDDPTYIINNPLITDLSGSNISSIFSEPYFSNYQPLHILSYAIEHHFFGLNPIGYHSVSLGMHILIVLLVILLSNAILKNKTVSFICGLLFAIHPMHVESVAWASERKDLLYAMFFFSGLLCYNQYVKSEKAKLYFLTFIFFLLSTLSKAMAASFPLTLIAFDLFYERGWRRKVILEKLPFFMIAVVFGYISYSISSADGSIADTAQFSMLDRTFFASGNLLMYCVKLLVPINLSAYYPYPVKESLLMYFNYISPIIVVTLLIGILRKRKSLPLLFFCAAFFVATIVLVLQLIPVGPTVFSERYSYIPSFSFLLLISYYFYTFCKYERYKKYLISFAILYVCFLSYSTMERNRVWNNSVSLWDNVLNQFPDALHAINNRADAYFKMGRYDDAINDFSSAITLDPEYAEAYYNRGNALGITGQMDKAMEDFNMAIRLDQTYAEAYNRRAQVLASQGKIPEALNDFKKAIEIDENNGEFLYSLAITYLNIHNQNEACNILRKASKLKHTPSMELYGKACQ